MNCPSRTDNVDGRVDWNQNPNLHAGTTREDFNGRANARVLERLSVQDGIGEPPVPERIEAQPNGDMAISTIGVEVVASPGSSRRHANTSTPIDPTNILHSSGHTGDRYQPGNTFNIFRKIRDVFITYSKFVGPGFMISVAYIDPGNYSTGVAAGSGYQFKLLFVVLLSNIIAIYLQSLCIKLGTVSGMNLAQMCRAHLPRWLNYFLYGMAEAAIVATDIAEVIGTAIALNLLIPQIPLVAGCAISIFDVLLILLFYRPNGSMKGLRLFELFVMALVIGVVICFCIQLSLITNVSVGEVFHGYLPSGVIGKSDALYLACGILGATVMPHSLYLGSGIVQPRLVEYDINNGHLAPPNPEQADVTDLAEEDRKQQHHQPSIFAIKACLGYSTAELGISLFTFALFVNSAIVITAGASLYGKPDAEEASLFSIHKLLSTSIGSAAGTIFALALLFSGVSAGIVCTIAGQMVSEGALNWRVAPWLRRLITRCISITPSIIIAGAVGKDGLSATLNGTQVALSIALPFVSAPIIYFTCRNKYMSVGAPAPNMMLSRSVTSENPHINNDNNKLPKNHPIPRTNSTANQIPSPTIRNSSPTQPQTLNLRNHWLTTTLAILIWIIITVLNIANIVLLGLGK